MFTNTSLGNSILIGCGPRKSNFQTLVTESSNAKLQVSNINMKHGAVMYKTQRMYSTDFCPPHPVYSFCIFNLHILFLRLKNGISMEKIEKPVGKLTLLGDRGNNILK